MKHILISSLVLFFSSIACGIAIYVKGNKLKGNMTWSLFCISVGVWSQILAFAFHADNIIEAHLMFRVSIILSLFASITYFHYISTVTQKKENKTIISFYYFFVTVISSLIFMFPRALIKVLSVTWPFVSYVKLGSLYFVTLAIISYFLGSSIKLALDFLKNGADKEKKYFKYFMFGMIFIPFMPLFIIGNMIFFSIIFYGITLYILGATFLLIGHSIRIPANRTSLYGVFITSLNVLYLVSIFLFESLVNQLVGYHSLKLSFVLLLVISGVLFPLRNKIQSLIDKIFFRTKYDYHSTIKGFSESMVSMLDVKQLVNMMIRTISDTMQAEHVGLLLLEKNEYNLKAAIGLKDDDSSLVLSGKYTSIQYLRNYKNVLIREDLLRSVQNKHSSIIKQMDAFSSELFVPLFFDDKLIGVLTLSKKKSGEMYFEHDLRLLKLLGSEASIALTNAMTYTSLKKSYWGTVRALANAIEAKDVYTCGHSERVVLYATAIGKEMDLSLKELDLLQFGGILHDIGKIGIKDTIIRKNTKLTDEEFEIVKTHPQKGEEIIAPIKFLQDVRPLVKYHHERWDGQGYPDGKFKEDCPVLARIIQVADTFDAITSTRSYRDGKNIEDAIAEIQRCAGTQFDPTIVYYLSRGFRKGNIKKEDDLKDVYARQF